MRARPAIFAVFLVHVAHALLYQQSHGRDFAPAHAIFVRGREAPPVDLIDERAVLDEKFEAFVVAPASGVVGRGGAPYASLGFVVPVNIIGRAVGSRAYMLQQALEFEVVALFAGQAAEDGNFLILLGRRDAHFSLRCGVCDLESGWRGASICTTLVSSHRGSRRHNEKRRHAHLPNAPDESAVGDDTLARDEQRAQPHRQ